MIYTWEEVISKCAPVIDVSAHEGWYKAHI